MPDSITTDVLIAAPLERVWHLITSAEHVGRWFGDAGAEIELRAGGRFALSFEEHGTFAGRVEAVEPPHRFAWRWLSEIDVEAEPTAANSTLTEFTLAAAGDRTRVTVVESGFEALEVDASARTEALASHTKGWSLELGELKSYAEGVAAG